MAERRASRNQHRTATRDGEQLTVLDLFAGAGGLTCGLQAASSRFRTVRAVENDTAAAATFAANYGLSKVFAGPIEDWLKQDVVPSVDVIVGGPPCQGFSTLGKRDAEDARNELWREYAKTIAKAQPRYFVVENVAAFLRSPQLASFHRTTWRGRLLADYTFEARVLNAADYGAPQVRRRAVLIGHHRDLPSPGFPEPTHARDSWVTVEHALRGLPEEVHELALPDRWTWRWGRELPGVFTTDELHLTRRYAHESLLRIGHVPPGGNRHDIPDELLTPCWRGHTTGSGDVMGRLVWNKPSVTIRTEFFKPEKGRYLHPTEHRAITHQEAARIQGFPDRYRWVGTKADIARQIGNAVPVQLGHAIGMSIVRAASESADVTRQHIGPRSVGDAGAQALTA